MNKKTLSFITLAFLSSTLMMAFLEFILASARSYQTTVVTTLFGYLPLTVYVICVLVAPIFLAILSQIWKISLTRTTIIYGIILLLALTINFIKFYFSAKIITFDDISLNFIVLGVIPFVLFLASYFLSKHTNIINQNIKIVVGSVGVIIFIAIIATSIPFAQPKIKYNATLTDLKLSESPMLLIVDSTPNTFSNTKTTSDISDYLILSTDGKLNVNFTDIISYEFISPTKLLIAGEVSTGYSGEHTGLYIADKSSIQSIKNDLASDLLHLSLSPSQQYVYYETDTKICVSKFRIQTLDSCVNVKNLLPTTGDNSRYYYDNEWLKVTDQLILTVRDKEEHYEIPSASPNTMPPQRIQKEVARFSYDPITSALNEMSLPESIILKTKEIFLQEAEKKLAKIFNGDEYKLIYDSLGGTLGIEELQTGKKTKLASVPYLKDMPLFDVIYY